MPVPSKTGTEPLRILITGANGFVGRHLIAHLLDAHSDETDEKAARPLRILAAVRPNRTGQIVEEPQATRAMSGWDGNLCGGTIELTDLDMCDEAAIESLIAHYHPHEIYHLAARASGADVDRATILAVNVQGTRYLLEAASRLSPFPRVLIISTGYVYGDTNPARPASENDPIGPLWRYGPYTDSKIEMENVAKAYRGFAIVLRPFAHTGPGQLPTFAIPAFASQLARIERGLEAPILRVGNLDAYRDILDARDIVRAYHLLMRHGIPGETYNLATGQAVQMRAVLNRLRELCTVPTEITFDPSRMRPADIAYSTGDPLRTWLTVGWKPRLALEETLRDTLNYWRIRIRELEA